MNTQVYKSNFDMQSHFSRVAAAYRAIRTTDVEPIFFIKEKLKERDFQIGADIGCGCGRYDRLLMDHLPLSHLFCLDANPDMVNQAHRFLCETRAGNFSTSVSMSELLPFKNRSLDCVFTFNAVHHYVFEAFLRETGSALKHLGRLFIYTRLPAQNEASIWGKYFPGFTEKETRLFELEHMKRKIGKQSVLVLEEIKYFRYQRVSSLERLLFQVRKRHYSTFSLYTSKELDEAVEGFTANILAAFPDPDHLEWTDGNVMLVLRRMHP
jgi:SAM-dependent methyltransferase